MDGLYLATDVERWGAITVPFAYGLVAHDLEEVSVIQDLRCEVNRLAFLFRRLARIYGFLALTPAAWFAVFLFWGVGVRGSGPSSDCVDVPKRRKKILSYYYHYLRLSRLPGINDLNSEQGRSAGYNVNMRLT
jgi:hypothetical protein